MQGLEAFQKQYAFHDIVFVHLAPKHIFPLQQLRNAYPSVGLVITTGDECRGGHLEHSINDCEGLFILPKPYRPDILLQTIQKSVETARDSHQH